jgi:hypothetical protein
VRELRLYVDSPPAGDVPAGVFVAFDADGNPHAERPTYPDVNFVWFNANTEPSHLGPHDLWVGGLAELDGGTFGDGTVL